MSYRGYIAELPLGPDGLTGTKNLSQTRITQLLRATNISYETGTITKEGGAAKYNAAAIGGTPSVIGGWDWWPSAGTQRMVVVTSAGDILKDDGGGTFGTTLKAGLTVTSVVPVFCEAGKEAAAGNRKLFIFTGKNVVQVLSADGATTADVTTPPTDWAAANQPVFGCIHEGRVWAGGNANDPHRLYYSTTTDHENFTGTGSGSISVYPGEGEKLVSAISYKGVLVCWKYPQGVYVVDTTDATVTNWRVTRLTRAVGMVSPQGAVLGDNDILWMDQNGNFQLLSAVTEFGDLASRNISQASEMDTFIRDNVAMTYLANVRAVYYPAKREAHFAVPGTGAVTNNSRLVVDFNRLDTPRFRWCDRDTIEALWLKLDSTYVPRPVYGDNAGFVWTMDSATKSKAGAAYTAEFQTPHTDFIHLDPKLATRRKIGQFLELVVEPKGNWDLSAEIYWDGTYKQTVTFNMGTTGAALGSFVLDTDKLAGDEVLNRKKRITGSGRRFSVVAKNAGAGQDFSVSKFILHFLVSDERL